MGCNASTAGNASGPKARGIKGAPTLGYWNIRAGTRGQVNRLCFAYAGVNNLNEIRYEPGSDQWATAKEELKTEFPNLPYISNGKFVLTESKAVTHYICEKYAPALLGSTPETRAHVRMLHEVLNDIFIAFVM